MTKRKRSGTVVRCQATVRSSKQMSGSAHAKATTSFALKGATNEARAATESVARALGAYSLKATSAPTPVAKTAASKSASKKGSRG